MLTIWVRPQGIQDRLDIKECDAEGLYLWSGWAGHVATSHGDNCYTQCLIRIVI